MASHVWNYCLSAIWSNNYDDILFDSMPDLTHREQLAQVIRFVDMKKSRSQRVLYWLCTDKREKKDVDNIEKTISTKLGDDERLLNDCSSQCYDAVQ